MASRKKKVDQVSLFDMSAVAPIARAEVSPPPSVRDAETVPAPIETYDQPAVVEERRLRIVPPPASVPESEVIVEPTLDGRFVVSLLRDHGTTVAAVTYTRGQLEMLVRRVAAALEVAS